MKSTESTHFESLYPETSRFEEIKKIIGFLREGNSVQLISLPGVGRSNLLGLLTYNTKVRIKHLGENQKWVHFVYLNFSEVKNKPLSEVTKFIFIGLVDSLRERKKEEEKEISKIFKESLEFNDPLVLFTGLKKAIDYLAIEKKYTIIFLCDRFETYIPYVTSDFFTNLRILRNRAKYRFSAVFSLNMTFEESLERELLSDFYEFVEGHIVYLSLLDKPGLDFRISYLEKNTGKKINKNLLNEILELTGGHGKLTRLCVEAILTSGTKIVNFRQFLLSHEAVQGSISEIWRALIPSEQDLLKKGGRTNLYLESVGLLKNGKIAIPLFEDYLKQVPKTLNLESLLNSDQLTSLESKLLKFLISNPNRVAGREEVILNVWGDLKTVQGVTDQALDQLILRLRKKIEDNPNSPTRLLTIKGRGFKFTP